MRIGSVPYLNARPLLEGLNGSITELVPARLFEAYQEGKLDAALLSSIDVISQQGNDDDESVEVVDGVAIASRGEVYSVILAYRGELKECQKVILDPSSHTSNALLQIILGEFLGIQAEYVHLTDLKSNNFTLTLPRLFIGDPAISLRKRTSNPEVSFLDLGEEWFRFTQLPFVFALWILRKDFTEKKLISEALREAKKQGMDNLSSIVEKTSDPEFSHRYLSQFIQYDLGKEEKKGLALFAELLKKNQLIDRIKNTIKYI